MDFQLRLRDYLAQQFSNVKKSKNDVMKDYRALQKLFKEAGRVKQVLSANVDHFAQVDALLFMYALACYCSLLLLATQNSLIINVTLN